MNPKNPLFDSSLSVEERIKWLLSEMTIEEKLAGLSGFSGKLDRLGIPAMAIGGEAAHGLVERNDQFEVGDPIPTTSFTQPLGMSATWDPELIYKAGEATGEEARVVYKRKGGGLVRWAPTVDLERDPRWGRNEEGYGEDPVLTGKMAAAFVKGLQGEDEKYLRVAATLKHFYGNNDEERREFGNASIDPRNKYELYLEPFRRVLEDAHAEAVMTAYNRINGVPGMCNPEVKSILKDQYHLGHAVSDGMAPTLAYYRHRYGAFSSVIADSVKAGVDSMTDSGVAVDPAAREAYLTGRLSEADLDEALANMFRTKLKLGLFDEQELNPFNNVTEEDLNSEAHQEVSRQVSRESVVLLKNEGDLLPLSIEDADDIALIGQMGDAWYHDWYGGEPFKKNTLLNSLTDLLGKAPVFADGCDRVTFETNGKFLAIGEDNNVLLSETPEVFIREHFGEGSNTFRSVRTGKLLNVINYADGEDFSQLGRVAAKQDEPFAWMVQSIFHVVKKENDEIILTDVFNDPVELQADGSFRTQEGFAGTVFKLNVVEDGIKKAVEAAAGKKAVIVALGCHPTVNAKETVDRKTIAYSEGQTVLLQAVAEANPHTVFALYSNYPYTIQEAVKNVPAVIWNTTGSQDIGLGMAEAILGKYAPAGRLNQTWYLSDEDLPKITDYDIIGGKRTYRYFDRPVLFPFGYGLTYTEFEYTDLKAEVKGDEIEVTLNVKNTGARTSDEVVQVYGAAGPSKLKKALKQLLGFERLHDVKPGETRHVTITAPVSEFRIYDPAQGRMFVESGEYAIFAGRSSADDALKTTVTLKGEKLGTRGVRDLIRADHYDSHENAYLDAGDFGFTCVTSDDKDKETRLVYGRFILNEEVRNLRLILKSDTGCHITVKVDGKAVGEFDGNTKRPQSYMSLAHIGHNRREMIDEFYDSREPRYNDIIIPIPGIEISEEERTLEIDFSGDAKILYGLLEFGPEPKQGF